MFQTTSKREKQVRTGKKKVFIRKSEKNAFCYLLLRIQVAKSLKTTSSHFLDGDDFFLTRYKLRADFTRSVSFSFSFPLELVCGASSANPLFFFLLVSVDNNNILFCGACCCLFSFFKVMFRFCWCGSGSVFVAPSILKSTASTCSSTATPMQIIF